MSVASSPHDRGFSLVEMLIVIVVLGVLSVVTVFAVRGITDRGEQSACTTDARVLQTAAEVYLASFEVTAIPATAPLDGNEFERTLVNAELLTDVSTYYDLDADGLVSTNGEPCT